ncbi:Rid family hydrolase [Xanthobacter sp. KR7-225]|uniref:Rid family hydrolase n=1 Tax=Xanthobacter sp. KR7-225 TaxID=3156613 RepID=UPI0032B59FC9
MPITPLNPPGLPEPIAPYSMGVKAGNTVYVSGVLALDGAGRTVGVGDARAQTKFVIETIEKILREGGASLRDVAFNAVIIKDMADYAAVNEVYRQYFNDPPPARYCIAAKLVRDDLLVEIASTAHTAAAG